MPPRSHGTRLLISVAGVGTGGREVQLADRPGVIPGVRENIGERADMTDDLALHGPFLDTAGHRVELDVFFAWKRDTIVPETVTAWISSREQRGA
jgi:hypothetical protein